MNAETGDTNLWGRLRERGVYQLLEGGPELVAQAVTEGGYNLYHVKGWHALSVAEYRIHPDGRVYRSAERTPWDIEDLVDTGLTASFWHQASVHDSIA